MLRKCRLTIPLSLLLIAMLFATAAYALQTDITPYPPLTIQFEGIFPIQLELREPVSEVLSAHRDLLPRGEFFYTVSAYRDRAGWAKITLVPTQVVESSWASIELIDSLVIEVIARQIAIGQWQAYLVGSAEFEQIVPEIPQGFYDAISPLPEPAGGYLFPWRAGDSWWATNGWHQGNAVDFQPLIGGRYGVLASESGRMRELCSDGYQSLLQIFHADGQSTFYLHVTLARNVRLALLDQNVERGQYLGEIIRQDRFSTACGQGNSRHLHFAVSDRAMNIEYMPIAGIADSASCCANPQLYVSSNQRVDRQP